MDFSEEYPIICFQEGEYMINSKLKIHKEAQLKELSNIKSSGRNVIERDVIIHTNIGVVIIGQDTVIQSGTDIMPCCVQVNEIGKQTKRDSPYISIGKYVLIKSNCSIKALRIGDNVVIGKNCSLGDGCVIKDNCVVDDNTIVPPFSMVAPFSHIGGVPMHLVDELPESFFSLMRNHNSMIFDKYILFKCFCLLLYN